MEVVEIVEEILRRRGYGNLARDYARWFIENHERVARRIVEFCRELGCGVEILSDPESIANGEVAVVTPPQSIAAIRDERRKEIEKLRQKLSAIVDANCRGCFNDGSGFVRYGEDDKLLVYIESIVDYEGPDEEEEEFDDWGEEGEDYDYLDEEWEEDVGDDGGEEAEDVEESRVDAWIETRMEECRRMCESVKECEGMTEEECGTYLSAWWRP